MIRTKKPYEPPRLTLLGTDRPAGFPELAELLGPGDDEDDENESIEKREAEGSDAMKARQQAST